MKKEKSKNKKKKINPLHEAKGQVEEDDEKLLENEEKEEKARIYKMKKRVQPKRKVTPRSHRPRFIPDI